MTPRRIQKLKRKIAREGYYEKRLISEKRSAKYWLEESAYVQDPSVPIYLWRRFSRRAGYYERKIAMRYA